MRNSEKLPFGLPSYEHHLTLFRFLGVSESSCFIQCNKNDPNKFISFLKIKQYDSFAVWKVIYGPKKGAIFSKKHGWTESPQHCKLK